MKISSWRIEPIVLRFKVPLITASGAYVSRRGFEIELQTAEGRVGAGEATALPEHGTETFEESVEALRLAATALESWGELPVLASLPSALAGIEALSRAPAARHGIELALLDLLAQEGFTTIARLLAGDAALASVPVHALLTGSEPVALGRDAAEALSQGYATFKVKVGAHPLGLDEQRLFAVRSAVGDTAALRVDANGAWTEKSARAALRGLAPMKIELCEQPVRSDDVEAMQRLRGEVSTLIAADESVPVMGLEKLLHGARGPVVDLLVLKPMVLGGLLPALSLARAAERAGIGSYVTTSLDGAVAHAGAVQLAAAMPRAAYAHGLSSTRLFVDRDFRFENYLPRDGQISVPDSCGLGIAGPPRSERR